MSSSVSILVLLEEAKVALSSNPNMVANVLSDLDSMLRLTEATDLPKLCNPELFLEVILAVANDQKIQTSIKQQALDILLFLYENKQSRKWLVDKIVDDSNLQCDLQSLAGAVTTIGTYDCQLVALDVVHLHFRELKKYHLDGKSQQTSILNSLVSELANVFQAKGSAAALSQGIRQGNENDRDSKVKFIDIDTAEVCLLLPSGDSETHALLLPAAIDQPFVIIDSEGISVELEDNDEYDSSFKVQYKHMVMKDRKIVFNKQEVEDSEIRFRVKLSSIDGCLDIGLPDSWEIKTEGKGDEKKVIDSRLCELIIKITPGNVLDAERWIHGSIKAFDAMKAPSKVIMEKTSIASLASVSTLQGVNAKFKLGTSSKRSSGGEHSTSKKEEEKEETSIPPQESEKSMPIKKSTSKKKKEKSSIKQPSHSSKEADSSSENDDKNQSSFKTSTAVMPKPKLPPRTTQDNIIVEQPSSSSENKSSGLAPLDHQISQRSSFDFDDDEDDSEEDVVEAKPKTKCVGLVEKNSFGTREYSRSKKSSIQEQKEKLASTRAQKTKLLKQTQQVNQLSDPESSSESDAEHSVPDGTIYAASSKKNPPHKKNNNFEFDDSDDETTPQQQPVKKSDKNKISGKNGSRRTISLQSCNVGIKNSSQEGPVPTGVLREQSLKKLKKKTCGVLRLILGELGISCTKSAKKAILMDLLLDSGMYDLRYDKWPDQEKDWKFSSKSNDDEDDDASVDSSTGFQENNMNIDNEEKEVLSPSSPLLKKNGRFTDEDMDIDEHDDDNDNIDVEDPSDGDGEEAESEVDEEKEGASVAERPSRFGKDMILDKDEFTSPYLKNKNKSATKPPTRPVTKTRRRNTLVIEAEGELSEELDEEESNYETDTEDDVDQLLLEQQQPSRFGKDMMVDKEDNEEDEEEEKNEVNSLPPSKNNKKSTTRTSTRGSHPPTVATKGGKSLTTTGAASVAVLEEMKMQTSKSSSKNKKDPLPLSKEVSFAKPIDPKPSSNSVPKHQKPTRGVMSVETHSMIEVGVGLSAAQYEDEEDDKVMMAIDNADDDDDDDDTLSSLASSTHGSVQTKNASKMRHYQEDDDSNDEEDEEVVLPRKNLEAKKSKKFSNVVAVEDKKGSAKKFANSKRIPSSLKPTSKFPLQAEKRSALKPHHSDSSEEEDGEDQDSDSDEIESPVKHKNGWPTFTAATPSPGNVSVSYSDYSLGGSDEEDDDDEGGDSGVDPALIALCQQMLQMQDEKDLKNKRRSIKQCREEQETLVITTLQQWQEHVNALRQTRLAQFKDDIIQEEKVFAEIKSTTDELAAEYRAFLETYKSGYEAKLVELQKNIAELEASKAVSVKEDDKLRKKIRTAGAELLDVFKAKKKKFTTRKQKHASKSKAALF